jgi:hypothetical protein
MVYGRWDNHRDIHEIFTGIGMKGIIIGIIKRHTYIYMVGKIKKIMNTIINTMAYGRRENHRDIHR